MTTTSEHRQQLASGIIVTMYEESPYLARYFPRFFALDRGGDIQIVDPLPPWMRHKEVAPFQECRLRCEEMGLLTCVCWPVKEAAPEGARMVILRVGCQVHEVSLPADWTAA